ncbi:MAG: CopD family protein, partial [Steroidobacteraceae bacterium]
CRRQSRGFGRALNGRNHALGRSPRGARILADVLSVTAHALSFVCAFQAAGAALFLRLFSAELGTAQRAIRRLGVASALIAMSLLVAHYALEAARMAGDLAGVWDVSLQKFVASSSIALATAVRMAGLALVTVGLCGAGRVHDPVAAAADSPPRPARPGALPIWLGALLVAASFALTGHTAEHPQRWILACGLLIHLIIVAFWFGALLPLILVTRGAPHSAGALVQRFSAIATALVPFIALAGLLLAWLLLPDLKALREPYGQLLLVKATGFAVLMGLASLNKWQLAPDLAAGNLAAARSFRISVSIEYALIVTVLVTTAVMTSFFSPDP